MSENNNDEVKRFIDIMSTVGPGAMNSVFGSNKKDKTCKVCGEPAYSNFCSKACVKAYHGTKAEREKIRAEKIAQRTHK